MRLLITGGFGYLGGRLAKYLSGQVDCELLLGSRLKHVTPSWLCSGSVVQTLWSSSEELEKLCEGVDVVVHLAGMNAQDCTADFVEALNVNGLLTARLLQAAIKQCVTRFIYLSTAHVYGSDLTGVITEDTCPRNRHPYARSHVSGEDAVRFAHQKGAIEGIVVRLSNAFGAPVSKDVNCWMLLVNDLCRQSVMHRCMTLRTSGVQSRDFVPISDVCGAIRHLMAIARNDVKQGVFNVGGKTFSVFEMASLIASRSKVVLGFYPHISRPDPGVSQMADGILDYRVDELSNSGFVPKNGFNEEIDLTLRFCFHAYLEQRKYV